MTEAIKNPQNTSNNAGLDLLQFQYASGYETLPGVAHERQPERNERVPSTSSSQKLVTTGEAVLLKESSEERKISQRADGTPESDLDADDKKILSQRTVEHQVTIPKRVVWEEVFEKIVVVPETILREEIVDDIQIVKETIIEVAKPIYQEKVVETPEIEYIDKVVEVTEKVVEEKIIEVPKIVYEDRIIEIPKIVQKIVESPEIEYREVIVEKIVEVPEIREQVVIKEVPVPQYVTVGNRGIAGLDDAAGEKVFLNVPVPVEAVTTYEYQLSQYQSQTNKVPYPLYAPRFVEVPVSAELYDASQIEKMQENRRKLATLASPQGLSLNVIEQMAVEMRQQNFLNQEVAEGAMESAITNAWKTGQLEMALPKGSNTFERQQQQQQQQPSYPSVKYQNL